jgi:hypothetical protein
VIWPAADKMGTVVRKRPGVGPGRSAGSTGFKAPDDKPEQTVVIFTTPDERLSAMDVVTGPCVPVGGRKHALVSVHQQEGPERPEQMAALYWVL